MTNGNREQRSSERGEEAYPLTLTTARESDVYNTGIRSRSVDDPGQVVARIYPDTVAESEAVRDDETVVESRRGAVSATVDADPAVPEGLVWLPIHHPLTNRPPPPRTTDGGFALRSVRLTPTAGR